MPSGPKKRRAAKRKNETQTNIDARNSPSSQEVNGITNTGPATIEVQDSSVVKTASVELAELADTAPEETVVVNNGGIDLDLKKNQEKEFSLSVGEIISDLGSKENERKESPEQDAIGEEDDHSQSFVQVQSDNAEAVSISLEESADRNPFPSKQVLDNEKAGFHEGDGLDMKDNNESTLELVDDKSFDSSVVKENGGGHTSESDVDEKTDNKETSILSKYNPMPSNAGTSLEQVEQVKKTVEDGLRVAKELTVQLSDALDCLNTVF